MVDPSGDITRDLREAARGDPDAGNRVWMALYGELRRLAHERLVHERADHTLSTTALVHEAYLKLVRYDGVSPSDRTHFIGIAARAMRQILVDYARRRSREKRGGGWRQVPLDEHSIPPFHPERDPGFLLDLDEAMTELQQAKPRLSRVVELRFFGGLTPGECAELLGVSERTVERDWTRARAYLYRRLAEPEGAP